MKFKIPDFLIFFFLGLQCVSAWATPFNCSFQSPPRIQEFDGDTSVYSWNVTEAGPGFLAADAFDTPLLKQYRAWVSNQTNPNPIVLLRRQKKIMATAFGQAFADRVYDPIIQGKVGMIQSLGCLESLLFDQYLRHFSEPTVVEFGAFVLSRVNSRNQIDYKVHLILAQEMGVGVPEDLTRQISSDLDDGWVVEVDLHNHPFDFENPYGDIAGTTIPSAPDVAAFKNYRSSLKLGSAWITNGISTIKIPHEQFNLLVGEKK